MVSNKKRVYNPCKHCGKTNHPKNILFKWRHELAKAKKKSFEEQSVSLCSYSNQPSKPSSNVEWIMDYGASNHMSSTNYLFNTYDTKKHTQQNVSIIYGNHVLVLGSCSVNVPNGTLEDVFHVQ